MSESNSLKSLSRAELLELLIEQTKRVEQLENELNEAMSKIENRDMQIKNSGSIAEAALSLNGVFQSAERAANLYQENIKRTVEENLSAANKDIYSNVREAVSYLAKISKELELEGKDNRQIKILAGELIQKYQIK